MKCDEFLQRLCDELGENLESDTCADIKAHLDECADCREQINSMRNTVDLFRCIEDKNVPRAIHERLLKILNVEDVGDNK